MSARPDLETIAREWFGERGMCRIYGKDVRELAALLEQAEARGRQEAFEPEPTRPDGFPSMDAERAGWQAQLAEAERDKARADIAGLRDRAIHGDMAMAELEQQRDAIRELRAALADHHNDISGGALESGCPACDALARTAHLCERGEGGEAMKPGDAYIAHVVGCARELVAFMPLVSFGAPGHAAQKRLIKAVHELVEWESAPPSTCGECGRPLNHERRCAAGHRDLRGEAKP